MRLEPVIGLEIHLQLKTASKMFCPCPVREDGATPNQNICPVCMGHPGTLPVPNEQAVRFGLLMGQALGCEVTPLSKFDRKHYFYPDLPKGYQISQYDMPIVHDGKVEIEVPGTDKKTVIGITRAHLEEDAAKSFHAEGGKTYVDFNRAGTPLLEMVTEPDFKSPQEAKAFLQELRLIARSLGVSDADMEKGQMRCDANVSLRQVDENGNLIGEKFNPKTEVKNMNSFRAVERALEYEIKRQTEAWEDEGKPVSISSTRGWNDVKQRTEMQRTKEAADDYRYFPEPDIPPLDLSELGKEARLRLPELPAARRVRFASEYRLSPDDARTICDDPALADYVEKVFSEIGGWIVSTTDAGNAPDTARMGKLVSGWLVSKLGGLLKEHGLEAATSKITPENFAEFIVLLAEGKLSTANGMTVLAAMLETGEDPSHVMEERQLGLVLDETLIAGAVDRVLDQNPKEVERYRAGEAKLMAFFIGMVMKETEGKVDPGLAKNMLVVKLERGKAS